MSIFTNEVLYAMNALSMLKIIARGETYGVSDKWAYTCSELATGIGAPEAFLQRILMNLGKAEIISVKRGPGGGFSISNEQLHRFKVLDVLTVLGQDIEEVKGNRASDRLNNAVYDALNVTLEEFLS